MQSRIVAAGLGAILVVAACSGNMDEPSGLDIEGLDKTVDPCVDFYQYACGGWVRSHPLTEDATDLNRFQDPFYDAVDDLANIVLGDGRGMRHTDDPNAELIGNYYATCLAAPTSTAARTKLRDLAGDDTVMISRATYLATRAAQQRYLGSGTFFRLGVQADPDDSTRNIVTIGAGGFELPSASYYSDPALANVLSSYRQHISNLSQLILGDSLDENAVIRIESALAEAEGFEEEVRDPQAQVHRMTVAELAALAPSFDWSAFLSKLGYGSPDFVNVIDPDSMVALDHTLTGNSLQDLSQYMVWQLIQDRSAQLDQPVLDEDFEFWSQLTGQATPSERDWTCFLATLNALGPAVAQPYIARVFDENVRTIASDASRDLKQAFAARLAQAGWIDEATRQEALAKLDAVTFLIGYPTRWPSYTDVLPGQSYFDDVSELTEHNLFRSQAALSSMVDRTEWRISPLEVNATYSGAFNQVTLTALWLAPPFVVDGALPARNGGSMRSIIGHELTHGFDDEGRHFDRMGNVRDWWSADAASSFDDRAQCLIDQFNGYEALPGQFVNGHATLGENIADLGGLVTAYHSLFDTPGGGGAGGDDFTAEQVFFLAYAQNFCDNMRPELAAQRLRTDPHSPSKFRVNGPLGNVPEFAKAFQCKAGSPMVRATPCQVW